VREVDLLVASLEVVRELDRVQAVWALVVGELVLSIADISARSPPLRKAVRANGVAFIDRRTR